MKAYFRVNEDLSSSFDDGPGMDAAFESVIHTHSTGILYGTTEEWNARRDLVSIKNILYVYTDHSITEDGKNIPGFKVGDGLAYLIDLPFSTDIINVSEEEKEFWNNKVTAYIDAGDLSNLVLSKE